MNSRYVFDFSAGGMQQVELLGGKGANLAEMTRLGLPVPPGFIITTEAVGSTWRAAKGRLRCGPRSL